MRWVEVCGNPNSVSHFFRSPPSLERFEVREVMLMYYSPSFHLSGLVSIRPDEYICRGQGEPPTSVEMGWGFYELSELSIEGIPQGAIGELCIDSCGERCVSFNFRSEKMNF